MGILRADAQGDAVEISFQPVDGLALTAPRVELTYLRSDRHTDVRAGENRGRRLQHDFVASPPIGVTLSRSGDGWSGTVNKAPHPDAVAVALWVTDRKGNYLQATGSWLDAD